MNKGNVLAIMFGILFCVSTGFFLKSKSISGQKNPPIIPRKIKKVNLPCREADPPSYQVIRMKATAYYPGKEYCGKFADGKTSISRDAWNTFGVAADPKLLPYRTRIEIPGIGTRMVDDTGGAMRQSAKKGIYHIDIRMHSYQEAKNFGVKWLNVKILN